MYNARIADCPVMSFVFVFNIARSKHSKEIQKIMIKN